MIAASFSEGRCEPAVLKKELIRKGDQPAKAVSDWARLAPN